MYSSDEERRAIALMCAVELRALNGFCESKAVLEVAKKFDDFIKGDRNNESH